MKKYYIGCAFLLLATLVFLLWPKHPASDQKPPIPEESGLESAATTASKQKPSLPYGAIPGTAEEVEKQRAEQRRSVVERIEAALNTSITFYGKVVDQNGDPVPNALVGYGLLDKFNESGSTGETSADLNGFIHISGVKGAVISVSVHKEGYYHIQDASNQAFAYGYGTESHIKPAPTKDNPAVFVLHKMGEAESLVELSSRQFQIPISGQAAVINLATGRSMGPGLHISSKVGEMKNGRFDWHYELSVPGGGLVEREGQFDFEAPESGYESSILLESKASDPGWKNGAAKSYFIKLPDNTYARVQARFYPRDYRNIVVLVSYLNPTPGNRNLEYDPAKRVKP